MYFPNLSSDALLAMAMGKLTKKSLLDMMNTRQNYVQDAEIDQDEFFNFKTVLKQQARQRELERVNDVLLPPLPRPQEAPACVMNSADAPTMNQIVVESNQTVFDHKYINASELRNPKSYKITQGENHKVFGYVRNGVKPTILDINQARFWMIYGAVKSRYPTPATVNNDTLKEAKLFLNGNHQEPFDSIVTLLQSTDSATILCPWMIFCDQTFSPNCKNAVEVFNKLVMCSHPTSTPVTVCFLDALDYHVAQEGFTIASHIRGFYEHGSSSSTYLPSENATTRQTERHQRWSSLFTKYFRS